MKVLILLRQGEDAATDALMGASPEGVEIEAIDLSSKETDYSAIMDAIENSHKIVNL